MIATERLEHQLDDFDRVVAREALTPLWRAAERGEIALPEPGVEVNLHAHTFFSYNAYGYSPSKFAWLARKGGLAAAGIVDFDVLDGVDEFLEAGRLIGLRTCASLESRVFVPEFATLEINSPGEPGVAYNMGVGFPRAASHPFLAEMRVGRGETDARDDRPRQRLSRSGHARLRSRRCAADAERQRDRAPPVRGLRAQGDRGRSPTPRAARPSGRERLGDAPAESAKLQGLIRAKTMKKGGVGYVAPDRGSFPEMAKMNRFVDRSGRDSDGRMARRRERRRTADGGVRRRRHGVGRRGAERHPRPQLRDRSSATDKVKNLYDVVALAERRGFPVIAGTEMNAPGQKFVDTFDADELKPLAPIFLRGAFIVYAHTASATRVWARLPQPVGRKRVSRRSTRRTEFFEAAGRALRPDAENKLSGVDAGVSPAQLLERLQ